MSLQQSFKCGDFIVAISISPGFTLHTKINERARRSPGHALQKILPKIPKKLVMKMRIFLSLLALSLLAGCKTTLPSETTSSMEDATSIQIECRNEPALQSSILMRLRAARAKDIMMNSFGEELHISAAFRVVDTPPSKVYDIEDDLQNLSGIFFVKIEKSHTVVRQP